MIIIRTPLTLKDLKELKCGDRVLLSGTIYTARDKAHSCLLKEKIFPQILKKQIIYYTGPSRPPKGQVCGSIGPTTSLRMGPYTKSLLKKGQMMAFIGKGRLSHEAKAALKNKALYFLAYGGAAALYAKSVISCTAVLYKDLGPEAVFKLAVKDMPLIVGIDFKGQDFFRRPGLDKK